MCFLYPPPPRGGFLFWPPPPPPRPVTLKSLPFEKLGFLNLPPPWNFNYLPWAGLGMDIFWKCSIQIEHTIVKYLDRREGNQLAIFTRKAWLRI